MQSILHSPPTHTTHSRIESICPCPCLWSCSTSVWEINTKWSKGGKQVQQRELYHKRVSELLWPSSSRTDTYFPLIKGEYKDSKRAVSSSAPVFHKLFSCFWWALIAHSHAGQQAECSGLDAFIWGTWSVYVEWCSVSMPCKMCTEPWASAASRKSDCKGRAAPEACCQHILSNLIWTSLRALLLIHPIFSQLLLLLLITKCHYVILLLPSALHEMIFPWQ